MDDERKGFTFIWKIKDFSFCRARKFTYSSPYFFVRSGSSDDHDWRTKEVTLVLGVQSFFTPDDTLECNLALKLDTRLPSCKYYLECDLSFLAGDGSAIYSKTFLNLIIPSRSDGGLGVSMDELFISKKHLFLPDDTLTIRFRIWELQKSPVKPVKCSAETRIGTKHKSFMGKIEKVSTLKSNSKNEVTIIGSDNKNFISSMNLCVGDNDKLHLEIKTDFYKSSASYKFKVFIVDYFKNRIKISEDKIYDEQPFCISLTISKTHLIENKKMFMPYEKLTLQCDVITWFFPPGPLREDRSINEGMVYEYDYQDMESPIFSEGHPIQGLTTLKDDLISLFSEDALCDIKLKTASDTFPAHSLVLSARSPVFKSMFTTDMREKTNSCVNIVDLDASTVRQMLLFMYSDNLDQLDFESAKKLYFAADKYNIVALRMKCVTFLKKNLVHSNCCEVLLLAEKHQDKDLKHSVQDWIAANDEVVFNSGEWKELEENHPRLTTEVFRAVYMKNRRT